MFVDIIPSEHSIGIHPLTYSVPGDFDGKIIPGCIVEIPVRNDSEYGIVIGFREYPPENTSIREVIRIVTPKEILSPYQIALILEISTKYLIPIHRVLGFFLSKWVIKRLEKKSYEQINEEKISKPIHEDLKNTLIIIRNTIITWKILEKHIQEWTIIICPDDFTLYRLRNELWIRDDIFYTPNESTETKKAQWWIDIRNKKYKIIVWNRKLLYYNLSAYSHILYLEDAFWREYFHYPIRIEYIDIFDMIDKQCRFWMSIISSVPRISTIHRFKNFIISHE